MLMTQADLDLIKKLDLKHPYVWLATWFGTGFLRPAPGTWGSALAVPFALILYKSFGLTVFLGGILAVTLIGFWATKRFEQATQSHDHSMIVIDEAVGQWIALLPVLYFWGVNPLGALAAFALFRLFDITKPWPVSWFDQKLGSAWGVMLDDIAAGLFAVLILTGVHYAEFG